MSTLKDTLSLYMVHHKPPTKLALALPNYIQHIQTGCKQTTPMRGVLGDNTGDNISYLNDTFAELTAHYWVWKNAPKTPFVGFQHYRRFFNFSTKPYKQSSPYFLYKKRASQCLNPTDILNHLNQYNLTIPRLGGPFENNLTVQSQYEKVHDPKAWEAMISYLSKKFSAPQKDSLFQFLDYHYLHPCILYVASYDTFNTMMTWLFDILFELKEILPKTIYPDPYQNKQIAFLAERLLTFYYLDFRKSHPNTLAELDYVFFKPLIEPRRALRRVRKIFKI